MATTDLPSPLRERFIAALADIRSVYVEARLANVVPLEPRVAIDEARWIVESVRRLERELEAAHERYYDHLSGYRSDETLPVPQGVEPGEFLVRLKRGEVQGVRVGEHDHFLLTSTTDGVGFQRFAFGAAPELDFHGAGFHGAKQLRRENYDRIVHQLLSYQ